MYNAGSLRTSFFIIDSDIDKSIASTVFCKSINFHQVVARIQPLSQLPTFQSQLIILDQSVFHASLQTKILITKATMAISYNSDSATLSLVLALLSAIQSTCNSILKWSPIQITQTQPYMLPWRQKQDPQGKDRTVREEGC